jgi:hypothetical protein
VWDRRGRNSGVRGSTERLEMHQGGVLPWEMYNRKQRGTKTSHVCVYTMEQKESKEGTRYNET